jgi:hypothetical protein
MKQNLDNIYFITYSNHFELELKTFSFRKKYFVISQLFFTFTLLT